MMEETIALTEAARRLGLRWRRAWDLVLVGELDGTQDASGRWRVTERSVNDLIERRLDERAGAS